MIVHLLTRCTKFSCHIVGLVFRRAPTFYRIPIDGPNIKMRSKHPLWRFKVRFESRTVVPLPLGANKIIRSGTVGTCACLDCMQEYSLRSIGLISKVSSVLMMACIYVTCESNSYLAISKL